MGDMAGLVDTIKKAVPLDGQPELYKRLSEGIFTLRDMYEQFSNILKVPLMPSLSTPVSFFLALNT